MLTRLAKVLIWIALTPVLFVVGYLWFVVGGFILLLVGIAQYITTGDFPDVLGFLCAPVDRFL